MLAANAGDGRVAWVSWEDCAAAASAWLAHGGREREAVDVTGPYDHSYGEVAAILSDLSGRPVRYEAISDEVAVDAAVAVGVPEEAAASIASFGQAAREGWFEVVGPSVRDLARREPVRLVTVLEAHRDVLLPAPGTLTGVRG